MITRLKAAVAAEIDRVRRRLMRQAAFGAAAAGLLLCALGFFLAACYMVLARQIGDVQAALIVGGGLIVVALGLFLAMDSGGADAAETQATIKANLERAKLGVAGDRAEAAGTVSGIVSAIAKELDGPSRDALIAGAKAAPKLTPVQLMMIAAAAGFFYGRRARRD